MYIQVNTSFIYVSNHNRTHFQSLVGQVDDKEITE